jgi:hypothetical protein
MTKIIYLLEVLLLVIIISCSNTSVEYDKPTSDGKLLVESYIKEGDTAIMVRLEKPISAYTWNGNTIDTTNKIHSAIVKIFIDGNEYLLNENPSPQFYWYGVSMWNSSLYSLPQDVKEFSNCSIVVDYDGKRYDASAVNPGKVKILSAEAKIGFEKKQFYFTMPVNIKCNIDYDKQKNNYFRVKTEVKYQYIDSYISTYIFNSYLCLNENTINEIEISSSNSNVKFVYPINYDTTTTPDFKNVTIFVERLSEEYYHLREALNAQHTDYDTPFGSEVTEIPSNINNGYGIFTCISRDSICANIIK